MKISTTRFHHPRNPAGTASRLRIAAILLLCGLFGSALLLPAASADDTLTNLPQFSDALEALSQQVGPAVVQILVSGYGPARSMATQTSGLLEEQKGTGSGVVLDPNGYIVTNAHVVGEARRVQVIVPDVPGAAGDQSSILRTGGRLVGAQLVGIDRETDLAVIKVGVKDLPFLELGDSDALRQGELVMAFGSPMGLQNSVSIGVVSSVARQLRPEDPMIYIQTDAAINPGNSGGPLVDTEGRVVGINTMILSQSGGSEGIGFAAPSNIVKTIYEQIKTNGHVTRGHIGVKSQTINPILAAGIGLQQNWGVVLGDVHPEGPADKAGLKIGDVIQALDGKRMENGRQFDVNVYGRKVGERISLDVLRGGEKMSIRVEVVERPDDVSRFVDMVSPERNLLPKLGILALDLDKRIERALPPLRKRSGVVVAARAADAPFWSGGLVPGDVIHFVNGREITDLASLRRVLGSMGLGDPVVMQIERMSEMQYVAFEFE